MATNTFERKIEITSPEGIKRLADMVAEEPSKEPISQQPYGTAERKRSEELLKQWLYRSKH